jgi:hypothetical protein
MDSARTVMPSHRGAPARESRLSESAGNVATMDHAFLTAVANQRISLSGCATTTNTLSRIAQRTLPDVKPSAAAARRALVVHSAVIPAGVRVPTSARTRRWIGAKVRSDREPRALDEHPAHLGSELSSRVREVSEYGAHGEASLWWRAVQPMSATAPTTSPHGGATPRPCHDPSCAPRRRAHPPFGMWQLPSALDSSDESQLPMARYV